MDKEQKIALLDSSLERAAEALGDITGPVMARYYERHPEAQAAFEHHGLGKGEKLEAEMMETILYCLMTWLERPMEIRIMLGDSVPHHHDTLNIRFDWYRGLVDAAIDTLVETIPPDRVDELEVWAGIRAELGAAIEAPRNWFRKQLQD